MGKIEKWHSLSSYWGYLDKTLIDILLEKSCTSHISLAYCTFALVAIEIIIENIKKKILKNYLIISSDRKHMLYEAETL